MGKIKAKFLAFIGAIGVSVMLTGCFKDSPQKAVAQCEFDFASEKSQKYSATSYQGLRAKIEFCRICMQRKGYSSTSQINSEKQRIELAKNSLKRVLDDDKVLYSEHDNNFKEMLREVMLSLAEDDASRVCSADFWN